MSKIGYGLNLRLPAQQKKKQPTKLPRPVPFGFNEEDDNDVEGEISRHASKNKSLKDIEEQQKKALEEDPTVFDYDGVYDKMKEKAVRPLVQDREERKPKYIQELMKKTKEREQNREIVYERKIAKERSKEDHLYANKDKFVTSAYKKKLAEQAKWMEEERLRELREQKDDVTKKSDLSDFYFNLGKNVAFGSKDAESRKLEKQVESRKKADRQAESSELENDEEKVSADASDEDQSFNYPSSRTEVSEVKESHHDENSTLPKRSSESSDAKPVEQSSAEEPKRDHHKRSGDALAAAKERFLSRKKAKDQ